VTARKLSPEALDRLVAEWAKSATVYAPAKTKDWTEYQPVKSLKDADLSRVNTKLPARGLLFPQCETMLRFSTAEPGKAETPAPVGEQVILGIRPCDASAIAVLDKFFAGQGETDTYYQRRRNATTLVGLACNAPADTCFCAAVVGSPSGTRGLDLLLTDLGEQYLAEPLTDKGEALIKGAPAATDKDIAAKIELATRSASAITQRIDTAALKERLDKSCDNPVWEELSLACVNCGACAFVCPTCHCFDITDETRKGKGARIRVWDTCQSCQYSQHASGHNPRETPASRFRNRALDKFKYTVDMIGELSCVGCGRCIIECPAGIDVRDTVETLMRVLPE